MIIDELIAILGYDVKGEGELDRFNRGLDRAQQRAQVVANRINAMSVAFGAFIGTIASQAFMRLSSTIGSLPGDVLKVGQEFENLETVLTTIEGSSAKAKEAMDWVQDFAATTPYDLNQVSEAFVRMRAYGLDPMSGLLERVGDASAGMGKSLMQGVEAIADAVTGENERLKEFGIKTKVEGDKITYNWNENGKEMSKTVRKNGPEIIAALMEIFGRFDGAMDKLSKTQAGILSNLGDSWTGFLKKIGDSGYYDFITRKLQGVQDAVERWSKDGTLDRWASAFSAGFIRAIQAVERWGKAIGKIGEAVGGRVGQVIADFLRLISGGDIDLSKWQALAVAAGVLLAVFAPMTAIVGAAIVALDDFFAYLTGGESYIGDFVNYVTSTFPSVADVFTYVSDMASQAWQSLATIDWLGLGVSVVDGITSGLRTLPAMLWSVVGDAASSLMEAFASVDWYSIGEMVGQNAIPVGIAIVAAILLGFKGIGEGLAAIVLGAIDGLVNLDWSRLGTAVLGVFEGIAKLILGIFVGLGSSIVDAVKSWFDIDLVDVGVRLGRSLLDGLTSVGASIKSWFASLIPDWAKGWFAEAEHRQQAGAFGAEIGALAGNVQANMNRQGVNATAATVPTNDNRDQSSHVEVNVGGVHVQQAVEAPAAAAQAVGNAVAGAAAPPARRMAGN